MTPPFKSIVVEIDSDHYHVGIFIKDLGTKNATEEMRRFIEDAIREKIAELHEPIEQMRTKILNLSSYGLIAGRAENPMVSRNEVLAILEGR